TTSTSTFIYNKTYAAVGTYTVTLRAISSTGCVSYATQTVTVTPSASAAFSYTPNSCSSKAVVFSSAASVSASTYYWTFGDGQTSTLANPTHTYAADGNYSVTLRINNTSTSAPQTVAVVSNPVVGAISRSVTACSNLYTFTNTSTGSTLTYAWTFSGGTGATSVTNTATRSYASSGTQTVDLVVTAAGRCSTSATQMSFTAASAATGVTAAVVVSASNPCNTTRTINNTGSVGASSYRVKLDGGAYVTKSTFPYDTTGLTVGTHTLKLVATNGTCYDTTTTTFVIGSVTAAYTSASSTCGTSVTFTNTSTSTSGTPTYAWNFNSGEGTSTSTSPTFAFATSGTKTVSLTATLANGCSTTVTKSNITANSGTGPVAGFTWSMVTGGVCNTGIRFTSTSTGATSYTWNYGDGTVSIPSSTSTIFHSYASTGSFLATLTASSGAGCSSITTATVVVTATGYPKPESSFSTATATQCVTGNRFDFFNRTTYNGAGWVPNYYWEFGDGTHNYTNTHVYGKTYAAAGTYQVRLVGVSNYGCKDTSYMNVVVQAVGSCTPGMIRGSIDDKNSSGGSLDAASSNTAATGLTTVSNDISDQVILYPNPNTGDFKLGLKDVQSQSVNIVIVDMLGREVYEHTYVLNGRKEIDLYDMNLSAGTYNLVLRGSDEAVARKSFAVVK
ncbi:MAG: hypothetical protein CFE21_09420, partial [Bacteroidetes bacterium B1(2017)]